MSGMWGADVNELRRLAQSLQSASEQIATTTSQVSAVVEASGWWQGGDADDFRGVWSGASVALLRGVGQTLADASQAVLRNADQQFDASTEGGALPSPGVPGGGLPGGPGGGPLGGGVGPLSGSIWDVSEVAAGAIGAGAAIAPALKTLRTAQMYVEAGRRATTTAAALARLETRAVTQSLGIVGNISRVGRYAAGAGGVFGIIGGFDQMLNTEYDGVRGGIDRGMGALSVLGGAGSVAIAAGLLTNPVGIAVVTGAALVTGAWALGNVIYDNREAIMGFVSDPGPYLADGWNDVKDVASDVGDAIGDGVSAAGDAIGDGVSAAGDFLGGLFS